MKKNIFFIMLVMILGCGKKSQEVYIQANYSSKDSFTTSLENNNNKEYTIYEGVLPCKDCEGIKTTLQIAKDYQTFKLSEAPISKEKMPNADLSIHFTEGKLNTERGYERDPDATVYILNWEKSEDQQRLFVRQTGKDNELFEIGQNRKRLTPKENWVLKKKE